MGPMPNYTGKVEAVVGDRGGTKQRFSEGRETAWPTPGLCPLAQALQMGNERATQPGPTLRRVATPVEWYALGA